MPVIKNKQFITHEKQGSTSTISTRVKPSIQMETNKTPLIDRTGFRVFMDVISLGLFEGVRVLIKSHQKNQHIKKTMKLFRQKIDLPTSTFEAKLLKTHFTKTLHNNLDKSADEIIHLFEDKMTQYNVLKRSSINIVIKNVLKTTLAKKIRDAKKNNEPIPTELPEKTIASIERSVKLSQAQTKLVLKLTFEHGSESPKMLEKTFEVIEYLKDTATLVEGIHFNLNAMIKYITAHDGLAPAEIGQKYLNAFGSSESTDMFLNEKHAPDALPKLYKLKNTEPVDFFKLFSSEFLKVMDEYTTDFYFEMLQQFETQFSDKDFETIATLLSENKLSGQKIGTLANKFYLDGPDAARNFLNSL